MIFCVSNVDFPLELPIPLRGSKSGGYSGPHCTTIPDNPHNESGDSVISSRGNSIITPLNKSSFITLGMEYLMFSIELV